MNAEKRNWRTIKTTSQWSKLFHHNKGKVLPAFFSVFKTKGILTRVVSMFEEFQKGSSIRSVIVNSFFQNRKYKKKLTFEVTEFISKRWFEFQSQQDTLDSVWMMIPVGTIFVRATFPDSFIASGNQKSLFVDNHQ